MQSLLLTLTVASLMLQPFWAQSVSSQKDSSEAVAAVRQDSQVNLPLRAVWAPTLTDDVIFLVTQGRFSPTVEVPLITFYRVTPAPYELRGNKIEGQFVEVDNYREWLVAVDQEHGQIYLLQGSSHPTTEFNRLMQSLHLRVNDAEAALGVFDLFLKSVEGEQVRSRVVGDSMKLQSVALDDFRARYPLTKSRAAFNTWWSQMRTAAEPAVRPPQAEKTTGGFAVRYLLYDQGSLRKQILKINPDATVRPTDEPQIKKQSHSITKP